MKKTVLLAGVLLALVLLTWSVTPVALAQGTTGDKVVMGDTYILGEGQTLGGNLLVMGGNAQVESGATVDGDVTVLGGMFELKGTVTGNLSIVGGTAQLDETAVVDGNLSALGGTVNRAPGAVVRGNTQSGLTVPSRIIPAPIIPDLTRQGETPRSWFGRFIGWQFGTLGAILLMGLLGFVLVLVAPRAVGRVASATAVQPALTFIFGLLTLVVGVLAGLILLIACGLGLLIWLALAAASVLGWIGVALWVGQRLLKALNLRSASSIAEVLVGVVVITFLSRVPCIGWVFGLLFASWGLGAVVLTRFGTRDADAPTRPAPVPVGPGGEYAGLPESSAIDAAAGPVERVEPAAGATLTDIVGINADLAVRLREEGIRTVADVANSHPVALATATGVPVGQIVTEDWIGQAQRLL